MTESIFIVQAYRAKPHRLVPLPARVFDEAEAARREAQRLAPYRAGVVVLAQATGGQAASRGAPTLLAVFGTVPEAWHGVRKAA